MTAPDDSSVSPRSRLVSILNGAALALKGLGTMWGIPRAQAMLADAGFSRVTTHELPHDPQNVYYVCRP